MNNSEVTKNLFDTIIKLGGRNTSENYMKLVLETVIKRDDSMKLLESVKLGDVIKPSSSLDQMDSKELGGALNKLVGEIAGIAGDQTGKDAFLKEISCYIGQASLIKLKNMGVNILFK